MPIAFYCRARPQNCDAFKIFKKAGRVFIGYPLVRMDESYNPKSLANCLVNPDCPEAEWEEQIAGQVGREYTRNRNFISKVEPGSIVVIPRPSDGVVYVGRITGKFEIVNFPNWGEDYLNVRRDMKLDDDDDKNHHIADVAQGWEIDKYIPIDYSRLPGWLRRSLLGRSTYNELPSHPLNQEITAYSILKGILDEEQTPETEWSLKSDIVKNRLVNSLGNPCAFENLVIALLQLENPEQIWHHTGGPGDGGIDGFGSDEEGKIIGLMQAKYFAENAPALDDLIMNKSIKRYAAVFLPENPADPMDGTCLLNLDWIVNAVRKHWKSLPLALTLRIGERCHQEH